jgi:hypothetical protein
MPGLYLDMVKRTLCNLVYEDRPFWGQGTDEKMGALPPFDVRIRVLGQDLPTQAHTMIGWHRLTNIEACGSAVIEDGIPGDFVETGVARGGAAIFMRAVLKAYGVTDRRVIACDTFMAAPQPPTGSVGRAVWPLVLRVVSLITRIPSKRWRMTLYRWLEEHQQSFPRSANPSPEIVETGIGLVRFYADHPSLFDKDRASLAAVRSHFARYGLLDSQVLFLEGFFADTLPKTPIDHIAVLRLDGDTYESTRSVLDILYHKVSSGGYVIIDDYLTFQDCRRAVDSFRQEHGITDAMAEIDENGVFWKKS